VSSQPVRATLLTLAMVAAAAAIAALALALGLGEDDPPNVEVGRIVEAARSGAGADDPLAWSPSRSEQFAERATLGTSHVIYEKSPGGVEIAAERTAEWRAEIEAAARGGGVDPDLLEAMVFLESAGRPEVMADGTPRSATGLTQIIPSTAVDLLGMQVDLGRSIELTRDIGRAAARGKPELAKRLVAERAEVDQRFDPEQALAGAAEYLRIARERFGSEQLAVVSYHMGIGNLESVIAAYSGDEVPEGGAGALIDELGLDYPRLFFDSSPERNRGAWELLSGFGDDSSLYYWRVLASLEILRLWRDDPDALDEREDLITEKATLEELYHPEGETDAFETADDVLDARADGDLVALPADPSLGFRVTDQAGELANELGADPELYRALRPEALATLVYLAARVQAISGETKPLKLTSATRDQEYQDVLIGVNPEATQEYSLHTTGWSFDIRRDYASDAQARAFQFVLDRLRAHAIIDYAYEPAAIHVTVSELGRVLTD
jgi:soluble lytic murein transglycosylase-like protein